MKKIIGIVPYANLFRTEYVRDDSYNFVNNYCERIYENNGIPIGILGANGYITEDSIKMCDSILICGGNKIYPYHFQAVEYAIKYNKKILGICLGMQVIHSYFIVKNEAEKRGFSGKLIELYEIMKKEKYMFVTPIEKHWNDHFVRNNIDDAKHVIHIEENTNLSNILNENRIKGASMHKYIINNPSSELRVSAYAEDGAIEGIEYSENIVGIQFHPEVDLENNKLFEFLCK